ncbi:MAG: sugar ABC transporter permease [Oscillospiraceae bacterium]|nr:sugar ABC transporter permease [Oscillospiraceae bacterium]
MRKKTANFFSGLWADRLAYALVGPYMILFIVFTVLPILASLVLSLTSFNMLEKPVFIFMDNYRRMLFEDDIFPTAIRNTLLYAAVIGPLSYLLSLLLAWFINELHALRPLVTLIFYAPSITGSAYLIWTLFFSGDAYGYANGLLMRFGLINSPIIWLKNPVYMPIILIIVSLWISLGSSFLSFIAGFKGVDKSYYEAGAIDGITNRWQELWFVTLPLMKPQMVFGAVMSISGAFGIGALVTGLFGFPSTDYVLHTLTNHLDDYGGQRYEMGYACAIAFILFVLMVAFNIVFRKLIGRVGK